MGVIGEKEQEMEQEMRIGIVNGSDRGKRIGNENRNSKWEKERRMKMGGKVVK